MTPEELLHLFGPFLPTDRFRALLRAAELPTVSEGAALLVDMSGFTPLADRLVQEYGPRRASEELKRRLNPMFEAIAGQVFHHGGSVIRFVGDGFLAWFDEQQIGLPIDAAPTTAVLRALAAGLNMQAVMPLFRGLQLKVAIGQGTAHRWVVGDARHGLVDMLAGPAVDAMLIVAERVEPGRVLVGRAAHGLLSERGAEFTTEDHDRLHVTSIPEPTMLAARAGRWPAWEASGEIEDVLRAVRPFVASAIREQIESGFGNFVGELRYALPMFIQLGDVPERPEIAYETLNRDVRLIQDVLVETGGRLVSVEVSDKGRVVYAVFGAPVMYGDDAERAILAALRLRKYGHQGLMSSVQRVGISRGLLYAGVVGGEVRREYGSIGDETNVAARLMSAAEVGQILVTSHVREEVSRRIRFREVPSISVKGKTSAIPVSEPLNIQTGVLRHAKTGAIIGRETEIEQIRSTLECVFDGQPQMLRLFGEAGIGKSRLLAELRRFALERGFQVVNGDCISTGRVTAYLPWRELIFGLLGLPTATGEEDADALRIASLTHALEGINTHWLVRLPLLGELLQLPIPENPITGSLDTATRRQALYALVTDLIVFLARQQPLVVVLEDVQWIDEVSEALALELARRLSVEAVPILLTLTHRPPIGGDATTLIRAAADLPIQVGLDLQELSAADVSALIRRYLDAHVPAELVAFVREQAQGNPFFVEEVIDALDENGLIAVSNKRVVILRDLAEADLPQTVQGLVQARIDRLAELDKLVLKVASVIGRQFTADVLGASMPVPMLQGELRDRLAALEASDLLARDRRESELLYSFRHAIVQEVTYQSLLTTQRRELHLAVAVAHEILTPDNVERLAYHFMRSTDESRARHYLLRAAAAANGQYANLVALDLLNQALSLTTDYAGRFSIYRSRLGVLLRIGSIDRAKIELADATALVDATGRTDWGAIVLTLRAEYALQISDWRGAIKYAQQALDLLRTLDDDALAWDAYRVLMEAYRSLDETAAISSLMPQVMQLSERLNEPRHHLQLILRDLDDLDMTRPAEAMRGAEGALAQAQGLADLSLEAECWALIASFHRRANDRSRALSAYKRQISLLRQIGNRRAEGNALNNIGSILVDLGQFSEANACLTDAYKTLHQIGERWGEGNSLSYLGLIAGYRRAHDEAIAYLNRSLDIARILNARREIATTLFHLGNTYMRRADLAAAEAAFREALSIYESLRIALGVAEVHGGLAELFQARGQIDLAAHAIDSLTKHLTDGTASTLRLPGLAFWRAIQVIQQSGNVALTRDLWRNFRVYNDASVAGLTETGAREAFLNNIWYHRALIESAPDRQT